MRDDTRRRLDRLIWLRRAKMAGGAGLIGLVIGAGLWLQNLEATVENKKVAGVVTSIAPFSVPGSTGKADGLSVDVALEDGRHARVVALKTTNPQVGEHVVIAEHIHATGRHTFSWK